MMQLPKHCLLLLVIGCLAACSTASKPGQQAPAAKKLNVIYILADDLGYAELGSYGNTFNETPHLDRMAAEGLRFTQAYAAAPVCSPYRAALMAGQEPAR